MEKTPAIQQGWLRALLYFILAATTVYLLSYLLRNFLSAPFLSNSQENELMSLIITYFIWSVVLIGLAFLFRKVIDKNTFYSLGFQWKGYSSHAATGFFLGILLLTAGSLILVLLQFIFFTSVNLQLPHLLVSLTFFILVAFTEEIAFRGYILNNLMQSMNKWWALALSSFAFGIVHISNPSANYLPIFNIFVAGFLLGINYIYTKNLWFAIALHFSWNFFQGPILGYEVSGFSSATLLEQTQKGPEILTGGNFGFEGSILCLALSALAIFLLSIYYSKQQYTSVEI